MSFLLFQGSSMQALKFKEDKVENINSNLDEEKVEFVKGSKQRLIFKNAPKSVEYTLKISTLINGKTIATRSQILKPKSL